MNEQLEKEVECSICVDALKGPIRILSCGHNFCQACLEAYCRTTQPTSCPNCRKLIALPQNGVKDLARNHTLENIIEGIRKMKPSAPSGSTLSNKLLSGCSLDQLMEISDSHMEDHKYNEALQLLRTVRDQQKHLNQVLTILKIIHCQMETEQSHEALVLSVELEYIIDSADHQNLPMYSVDDCYDKFNDLIKKFAERNFLETALSLQRSLFYFIKLSFDGESRANKLSLLGIAMRNIAAELKRQNKSDQFKKNYKFMDEVLDELQAISNVDLQFKCKQITWFLNYYGFCCNETMDYNQSIVTNNQAIFSMKLVFGNNASYYRVFGTCHHNIALAYHFLNQIEKALVYYKKALAIKQIATDWPSAEQREDSLLSTAQSVQIVTNQLKATG